MGMFMNDPLALAKRADEPLYANPKARGRIHAIQRTIPILAVTEDGIFKIASDKFSNRKLVKRKEFKEYLEKRTEI